MQTTLTKRTTRTYSLDEVHLESMLDPEYRREWEKHAFGHAVALWLIGYRAEHGLTQAELAARVGMPQPQIARLEFGENEPRMGTLRRIATALGVELRITVHTTGERADLEPFVIAELPAGAAG